MIRLMDDRDRGDSRCERWYVPYWNYRDKPDVCEASIG
jgi:hypothetical protein